MIKSLNKFELLIASISICITIVVSSIFGAIGPIIAGTFWSWFALSFVFQIICFFVANSFLVQRERVSEELLQLQTLDKLANFTVQLSCAYCKQPNNVIIQLNQKNTFKCESCNQTNGVFMQFSSTTLTTPIELSGSTILKQAE
jgi:hypothetical protein